MNWLSLGNGLVAYEEQGGVILQGDVRECLSRLPDESIHCVVTSPPYWGLRSYKTEPQLWSDGWRGEHGLEPTIAAYIANEIAIWRAVRRVLRDDGVAFVNIGDSYISAGGVSRQRGAKDPLNPNGREANFDDPSTLPQDAADGNLALIPQRLAIALQDDGWTVRSWITWIKGMSLNPDYSGSVMPESVNGTEWRRCRMKVTPSKRDPNKANSAAPQGDSRHESSRAAKYADCPGCPTCVTHGGYVLRRGSWRPTTATEVILILTKDGRYWSNAVKEIVCQSDSSISRRQYRSSDAIKLAPGNTPEGVKPSLSSKDAYWPAERNLRNAFWCMPDLRSLETDALILNPEPSRELHYASFPSRLVEVCLKAGCPALCCPKCGAGWAPVLGDKQVVNIRGNSTKAGEKEFAAESGWDKEPSAQVSFRILSYRPTCECNSQDEPAPGVVLDPFLGSGTVALTARRMGRRWIGIELQEDYIAICKRRSAQEQLI